MGDNNECISCGGCCTRYLPMSAADCTRLASYIRTQQPEIAPQHGTTDFACPFRTSTGECSVNEARPDCCRTWSCDQTAKPRVALPTPIEKITIIDTREFLEQLTTRIGE